MNHLERKECEFIDEILINEKINDFIKSINGSLNLERLIGEKFP